MSNNGKITIRTNGSLATHRWNIFLDDKEITHYIKDITIRANAEEGIPHITLEFVHLIMDVPDEIYGMIEIYKPEQKESKLDV